MAIYNKIGSEYNSTRKADPYIAGRLYELLSPKPGGSYLDIGCGTGNYLKALSDMGVDLWGVDPSEVMLQRAKEKNPDTRFIQASAEQIPLPDETFDGAMAVLTIHHWRDMLKGLKEVNRLLKPGSKMVFFSFTPEQMRGYWLCHYFPIMMERCTKVIPELDTMINILKDSGFKLIMTEKYFIREDLQDHFLYSSKFKPEMYLSKEIRNNTSGFSLLCDPEELQTGLSALRTDIQSGAIRSVIDDYANDNGDYLFLVAEK